MVNKKPLVIAISAVSGGGKTTITNYLNTRFTNSKALFFDNYQFDGPDDICDWVLRGADYNEWNLDPLVNDVRSLLSASVNPHNIILLDYPFSYIHKSMAKYIDYSIFIDVPLDIAMARRILRDFKDNSIDYVKNQLHNYLNLGRTAYIEMLKTIKPSCNFIINGLLTSDIIGDQIQNKIKEEFETNSNEN